MAAAEILTAIAAVAALILSARALQLQAEATQDQAAAIQDQANSNQDQIETNRQQQRIIAAQLKQERRRFASRVAVYSPPLVGFTVDEIEDDTVIARVQNRSPASITRARLVFLYRGPNVIEDGVQKPARPQYDGALIPLLPPCSEVLFTAGDLSMSIDDIREVDVAYMWFTDSNGVVWEMTPKIFPREKGTLELPGPVQNYAEGSVLLSLTSDDATALPDCGEGR